MPPNLGGEFLTFFLGCFVNDLAARVMPSARVLQRGFGVLGESTCAGVVLAGPLADPGTRLCQP